MSYLFFTDIIIFFPETFFICCTLILLSWILIFKKNTNPWFNKLIMQKLIILAIEIQFITIALLTLNYNKTQTIFCNNLISDNYTILIKIGILICMVIFLSITSNQLKLHFSAQPELILLLLFTVFSLCILISSNDLLTLYLSIEMQSLCLYILTSFKKNSKFSSEAGLKYFILGALSSSILLFGLSLIYGATGHTNYVSITRYIVTTTQTELSYALIIGLTLLLIAFFFKLTAVPFHIWSPDVYEGAPFTILIFLSTVPKLSLLGIFAKLLYVVFFDLYQIWQPLLVYTAILTIIFSSIATLYQKKLKRFIAYSSINHVGYMLIGLSAGTLLGLHAFFFYICIYILMMYMFFSILVLFPKNLMYITDLLILKNYSILKILITIIFFSMSGIPPFVGFFSKFYIIITTVEVKAYLLTSLIILCSTISAFYYLRIIKIVQFESLKQEKIRLFSNNVIYIYLISSGFLLTLFSLVPNLLLVQVQYLTLWL